MEVFNKVKGSEFLPNNIDDNSPFEFKAKWVMGYVEFINEDAKKYQLPQSALATLFDEDPQISISGTSVSSTLNLTYLYITSNYNIQGDIVVIPEDDGRELSKLSMLANGLLRDGTLYNNNPSLSRVKNYAEAIAFLRWAKKEGIHFDMSNLLSVQSYNQKDTPTPDRLER